MSKVGTEPRPDPFLIGIERAWIKSSPSARRAQAAMVGSPTSRAIDGVDEVLRNCLSENKAATRLLRGLEQYAASDSIIGAP